MKTTLVQREADRAILLKRERGHKVGGNKRTKKEK
jgi:hypothetical protein